LGENTAMPARYIILVVGCVFLVLGTIRGMGAGWRHPQARTWLVVGAIFLAVAIYLSVSQR
jgi:hypothetical protein